jgi:peptidoglycan hydrolase CwlO-like protein
MSDKYKLCFFIAIGFLIGVMLSGCTKQSPTDSIISNTQQQIDNLSDQVSSLPKECNTTAIKSQLTAIKSSVDSVKLSCDTEKQSLNKDIDKWSFRFWIVVSIILGFIGLKIYKKVI